MLDMTVTGKSNNTVVMHHVCDQCEVNFLAAVKNDQVFDDSGSEIAVYLPDIPTVPNIH